MNTAPPKLLMLPERKQSPIEIGTVIASKYRVESILGHGGMAIVLAATHEQLRQRVAVKMLFADTALPAYAERILREARAAALLKSEHVTRVLDVGRMESGEPYLVMELLEGVDVASWLRERGPLSVEETSNLLLQVCDAVADAHAHGIVHRDLKASNLFMTRRRDGSSWIKLMDFGISKLTADTSGDELTGTQDTFGTPHYMSPEQLLRSRDVDNRTDIWSLGVILYRMLAGKFPFTGATTPAVHVAVASAPTPKVRELRADVPLDIENLIQRSLEKDPRQRLQTVEEFATVLLAHCDADVRRRYAHLHPSSPTSSAQVAVPASGPMDAETNTSWGTQPPTSRRRNGLIVALAVGVSLAVGASIFLVRGHAGSAASAPSSGPTAETQTPPPTSAPTPVATAATPTVIALAAASTASTASTAEAAKHQRSAATAKPQRSPGLSAPAPVASTGDPYADRH